MAKLLLALALAVAIVAVADLHFDVSYGEITTPAAMPPSPTSHYVFVLSEPPDPSDSLFVPAATVAACPHATPSDPCPHATSSNP